MLLELKQISDRPGGIMPYEFDLDLSELEFYGSCPFAEPIHVSGQVENHAGLLVMTGKATTILHVNCDRCGKPFLREMELEIDHLLADHLEDEENDDYILLSGTVLDAGDTVTDDMIYGMDSSNLCHEDCKGRCFRCGADLNVEECTCKPEIDPRMAALAKLLEQKD